MKYIKHILIFTAFFAMLFACRTQLYYPNESIGREVLFTVSAIRGSAVNSGSKASVPEGQNFTDNTSMGVTALKSIYTSVEQAEPNKFNIQYLNLDGTNKSWKAVDPSKSLAFLGDDALMNFFAYHPHTAQTGTSTAENPNNPNNSIIYRTPTSQSTIDELVIADLMWGNKMGIKESDGVVELQFKHVLSKLSFSLLQGGGWGSEDVKVNSFKLIATRGLSAAAIMNLTTGELIIDQQTPNLEVACNYTTPMLIDPNNVQKCEFILIPSSSVDINIEITVNGQVLSGTLTNLELARSTQTNITLNLHRQNAFDIAIQPDILDWVIADDIHIDGI